MIEDRLYGSDFNNHIIISNHYINNYTVVVHLDNQHLPLSLTCLSIVQTGYNSVYIM